MKPSIHARKDNASVLVPALLTITLLLIGLGAYLTLVSSQMRSASRSESWNMAITVAEAGVEEAHAHLNQNGLTNFISNGWQRTGSNAVTKMRRLGSNYFSVILFSNSIPNTARILSEGAVRVPGTSGSNYVRRTVEVTVKNPGILKNALTLLNTVGGNGGTAIIDSFSSTNGPYSLSTRRDHGDILCLGGTPGSVDVGNTAVYGKIYTVPGGTVTIQNGSVGDTNWISSTNGIEPGWWANNLKPFPVPNAPVAAFTGSVPDRGTYQGTNYTYILGTGNYHLLSLNLSGQGNMVVIGDAQLNISNNLKIEGNGCILVMSNASLKIFMDGQSATIAGNGVVNNNGLASKYLYYGSTNNTDINLAGNGNIYGVYFAPQADIKINGNGAINGAFVAHSVNNIGGASIHYDEELKKLDVGNYEWAIETWNEL
jgi:hypothetical protein